MAAAVLAAAAAAHAFDGPIITDCTYGVMYGGFHTVEFGPLEFGPYPPPGIEAGVLFVDGVRAGEWLREGASLTTDYGTGFVSVHGTVQGELNNGDLIIADPVVCGGRDY
jgi:hypothetical protein